MENAGAHKQLRVAPCGQNALVALRTGLYDFDFRSGALSLAATPPYDISTHRFNDGRCDRQGRYIVGSVELPRPDRSSGGAALYRFDANGLVPIVDNITCSNGLAFSPDGASMYLADTTARAVYVFDYDGSTGMPSNQRVFAQFEQGGLLPDGAEMDSHGGYWLALLGGAVARYLPSGELDFMIKAPVLQPTKMCFGGADLRTLFLTTAAHRHAPGSAPLGEQAGGLFAMHTEFAGVPEPFFAF